TRMARRAGRRQAGLPAIAMATAIPGRVRGRATRAPSSWLTRNRGTPKARARPLPAPAEQNFALSLATAGKPGFLPGVRRAKRTSFGPEDIRASLQEEIAGQKCGEHRQRQHCEGKQIRTGPGRKQGDHLVAPAKDGAGSCLPPSCRKLLLTSRQIFC